MLSAVISGEADFGVSFMGSQVGAFAVAAAAYGVVTPLWRALGASITALAERLYRYSLARAISMMRR